MKYNDQYQQLVSTIVSRRESPYSEETLCAQIVNTIRGFARYQSYLLWTVLLIVTQIAELYILTSVHFAFTIPIAIVPLRIHSAIGMLGIIAAFTARFMNSSLPLSAGNPSGAARRRVILTLAQLLFLLGACVGLAEIILVLTVTDIHRYTAPIQRAALSTAILSLPFELYSTFLLYNLSLFKLPPLSPLLRATVPLWLLAALGALYFNLPILYLLLRLGPLIVIACYLARFLNQGSLLLLDHETALVMQAARRYMKGFLRGSAKSLAAVLSLELSGWLLFSSLIATQQGLTATLYISHRLAHLVAILGAKFSISTIKRLHTNILVGDRVAVLQQLKSFFVHTCCATLFALFFLPLLHLRGNVLGWASHSGAPFSLSATTFLLLVLQIFSRGAAINALFWLSAFASSRKTLLAVLPNLFVAAAAALYGLTLRQNVDLTLRFQGGLALDLITSLIIVACALHALYARQLSPTTFSLAHTPSIPFLRELGLRIHGTRAENPHHLLLLSFHSDTSQKLITGVADELLTILGTSTMACHWSSRSFLVATQCSTIEEVQLCREKLLARFGFSLEQLKIVPLLGSVQSSLEQLSSARKDLADFLYDAAMGRESRGRRNRSNTAQPSEVTQRLLSERLILNFNHGWNLSCIQDTEIRRRAERFLSIIEQEREFLSPAVYKISGTDGIFALLQDGKVASLGYLPPAERNNIDAIRRACFARNMAITLSAVEGGRLV